MNLFVFLILYSLVNSSIIEQGWCSGETTCLPPMWPGFVSVLDAIHGLRLPVDPRIQGCESFEGNCGVASVGD